MKQRLVLGMTGASGILYGVRLLEILREHTDIETHLVVSQMGEYTRSIETSLSSQQLHSLADITYRPLDMSASIASGSFKTIGMIVLPCSMKSLAEIATGNTSGLVSRAADVVLKERRRLVLGVRETPLHLGHLENMQKVTQMGGIIAPPIPALYMQPKTIQDLIDHYVGRVLDLFDIDVPCFARWE